MLSQRFLEQGQRPPLIEDPFGRRLKGRIQFVARFCRGLIPRQMSLAASALNRAFPLPLLDEEMLEGGEQKGPKFASFAVGQSNRPFLQKVREKSLRQVLGILGAAALPAHIRIQRIPVCAAEFLQRFLRRG